MVHTLSRHVTTEAQNARRSRGRVFFGHGVLPRRELAQLPTVSRAAVTSTTRRFVTGWSLCVL
jgi:hypothetical protein